MMKANTKTIFNHLIKEMEKLSNGTINVDEAKAQANLAKQANNVLRYELDRAGLVAKFGFENVTIREIEES